jgi:MFS family permease
VAYLLVAAATNVPSFIMLIALVGLFSGAMMPIVNALIDSWAPPGREASAFGLSGSALALALAVAPLSGGVVVAAAGISTSFLVIGTFTLIVGVAVLALVREAHETPRPAEAPGEPQA